MTRPNSAKEFLASGESFLLEHESHHILVLGLASSLQFRSDLYGSQPYFALVSDGNSVVAAALMTPPLQLVLSLTDHPDALALIARDIVEVRPDLPGVIGPDSISFAFAETWNKITGRSFHRSRSERIYQLKTVRTPRNVAGRPRRAAESDRALLMEWVAAFQAETFGETDRNEVEQTVERLLTLPAELAGAYLWVDTNPSCLVGYSGPTLNGMRIGPVYTPPHLRGRGYASGCTAAVSQDLLDRGRRFCALFTDLSNPTSNEIYQLIGYEPVCDVGEFKFS